MSAERDEATRTALVKESVMDEVEYIACESAKQERKRMLK